MAVLVDEKSASAAEYLAQFLQRQGRAIVVGEHGTEGAGGYLERAAMPGGFSFFFTKGRTFFAGTDELNLEARGVTLDVRVPITEENEKAKREDRDVALEAGLVALGEEAARLASESLPGTTWQMIEAVDATTGAKTVVENPENYTITFDESGAVILGKANLSEWANYMDPCMPNGFSTLGGQTRNPYGPFETCGSSNGSAVAAAASLAAVTVGSEIQGSIIAPAGVNSVVGLKTSMGLVSRDYVVPAAGVAGRARTHGRTVTDVAVLLTALAGVDENDPITQDAAALATEGSAQPRVDFTQFLSVEAAKALRLGIIAFSDDDPAMTELRMFNLGDGGAMSGLLVAGRRGETGEAIYLVFLLE